MKLTEFEKRLQDHANSVKDTMAAPFNIEMEEITMTNKSFNMKKAILLIAAIICLIGTTALAAYHLLLPQEIAITAGYEELADVFEKDGTKFNIPLQQSGDYTIQILGLTSGKNLTIFTDADEDRSYIVGAVSRTDGGKLGNFEGIQMSPLISGYEPWKVNIFTLNGGKSEFISDDDMVDYFIYECDNIEIFADRTVYISFYEGIAPSAEIFKYNTDGTIEFNEHYTGVKALFEIPLDKSKSNPEKAAELVEQMWDDKDDDIFDDEISDAENTYTKEVAIATDFSITTEDITMR